MPIHPLAAHVPIALCLLFPCLIVYSMFVDRTPKKATLVGLWVYLCLLMVSALITRQLGEGDGQKVSPYVQAQNLTEHQSDAQQLAVASLLSVSIFGLLLLNRRVTQFGRIALLLFSLVLLLLALRAGHSGGELVYGDQASAAFVED